MKRSALDKMRQVAPTGGFGGRKEDWGPQKLPEYGLGRKKAKTRCSRISIISSPSLRSIHSMTLFPADCHPPFWQCKAIEQKCMPPTFKSKQRPTLGLLHWHFFSGTAAQRSTTSAISALHSPPKQTLQSFWFQPDTSSVIDKYDTAALVITSQKALERGRDFPTSEKNMNCSQGTVSLMTSKSSGPCSQPVSPKARLHRLPKRASKRRHGAFMTSICANKDQKLGLGMERISFPGPLRRESRQDTRWHLPGAGSSREVWPSPPPTGL